jgi:hypothetical protein
MNIYAIEYYGHYSGATTIVAAENVDDAISLAKINSKNVECVETLPIPYDGEAKFIYHYEWAE